MCVWSDVSWSYCGMFQMDVRSLAADGSWRVDECTAAVGGLALASTPTPSAICSLL